MTLLSSSKIFLEKDICLSEFVTILFFLLKNAD